MSLTPEDANGQDLVCFHFADPHCLWFAFSLDFSPSSLCCRPCARLMQTWLEFIPSKKETSTETHLGSACGSTADFLWELGRSLIFSLYQVPLIRSAGKDYDPCEMGDISHCISAPHGTVTLIKNFCRGQNMFSTPKKAGDWWPKGCRCSPQLE